MQSSHGGGRSSLLARPGGDTSGSPSRDTHGPRHLCNCQRDLATTGHSFRRLCFYSSSHLFFVLFCFFIWPSSSFSFSNTKPTHAAKHCYNPRTSYVRQSVRLGGQELQTMHLKHNFIGQTGYASTWKNYNLFYKHFFLLVSFF